jgi:N-methylhydantoinase A
MIIAVRALGAKAVEAVAVASLFGAGAGARAGHPAPGDAMYVSRPEISPEFREYERVSTVAINAYLGPKVANYGGIAKPCPRIGQRLHLQ